MNSLALSLIVLSLFGLCMTDDMPPFGEAEEEVRTSTHFSLFGSSSKSPSTLTSTTTSTTVLTLQTVPKLETTSTLKEPTGDDTDPGSDGTTGDATNDSTTEGNDSSITGDGQGFSESKTTLRDDFIDLPTNTINETSSEVSPDYFTWGEEPEEPSTTTTEAPPLPNFDPPNYKYKVLKNYSEDYFTPSVFLFVGLILVILTFGLHYYMDSKEKERQVVTGARFKPDRRKKAEDSSKSMSPTLKSNQSPAPKDSPVKPVPTKAPNSPKT